MLGCERNVSWKDVSLPPTPTPSPAGRAIFWCDTFLEKATFHPNTHPPYQSGMAQANGGDSRKDLTWGCQARLRQGSAEYKALPNYDTRGPRKHYSGRHGKHGLASSLCPSEACHDAQLPRSCTLTVLPGWPAPDPGCNHLLSLILHLPLEVLLASPIPEYSGSFFPFSEKSICYGARTYFKTKQS